MEDITIEAGTTYSLQRGDTIVVTLAHQPSSQQLLLLRRQLHALFRAQKVVVLEPGMTFQVYTERRATEIARRSAAAVLPSPPAPEAPPPEAPQEESGVAPPPEAPPAEARAGRPAGAPSAPRRS